MSLRKLAIKNIKSRPWRSAALIFLAFVLSFVPFGGTLIGMSLNNGLRSLKDRLGADIMVVPYVATTKSRYEDMVLQGSMGYFYMDKGIVDKIAAREGIGQLSTQLYLCSTSSGCCSVPVQLIGFDPETDFIISPWIKKSGGGELKTMDVVVGCDLNAFVGDTLSFYGRECYVAAKLDKTGTSMDTAIYANMDTIREFIASSIERKMNVFENIDPDRVVSTVLINVEPGYVTEEVLNDINIHVRKVEAFQSADMIKSVSDSLSAVAGMISFMAVLLWFVAFALLIASLMLSASGRKREFALMRAMGLTAGRVKRLLSWEAFIVCLLGSLLGILSASLVFFPFSNAIESALGLPYLTPQLYVVLLLALAALVCSLLAGRIAGALAAARICRYDAAYLLREDG